MVVRIMKIIIWPGLLLAGLNFYEEISTNKQKKALPCINGIK